MQRNQVNIAPSNPVTVRNDQQPRQTMSFVPMEPFVPNRMHIPGSMYREFTIPIAAGVITGLGAGIYSAADSDTESGLRAIGGFLMLTGIGLEACNEGYLHMNGIPGQNLVNRYIIAVFSAAHASVVSTAFTVVAKQIAKN